MKILHSSSCIIDFWFLASLCWEWLLSCFEKKSCKHLTVGKLEKNPISRESITLLLSWVPVWSSVSRPGGWLGVRGVDSFQRDRSSWIPFISLQQSFNFVVLEMELIMTVWTRLASSLWGEQSRDYWLWQGGWKLNQPSEMLYRPHEIESRTH